MRILFLVYFFSIYCMAQSVEQYVFQSKDFYVKTVDTDSYFKNAHSLSKEINKSNCREHIRDIICLVEPVKNKSENSRLCLDGGSKYAIFFETLYDYYPPALKRMFCSLNIIYIEKEFFGTAYAGILEDTSGNMIGAQMGIRQSVLDQNLSLEKWASWKEQLSFGGVSNSYTPSEELPKIISHSQSTANDFLYFVVAHEFGHIFDFANHLNTFNEPCTGECELREGSWGAISWITKSQPHIEDNFMNRNLLCFYMCENSFILKDSINKLYTDLYFSNFISTYSATQPWDDFADSLAYYLLNRNLASKYIIETKQGITFDILMKMKMPVWAEKYKYLTNFLERNDIIYP